MFWLVIALCGYFLSALASCADRFLLAQKWKSPLVYTTWAGLLTCLAFILWPLDFSFLGFGTFLAAFASGFFFFFAIFSFFWVIAGSDITRASAIVGGFSAFWVLILSYLFLGERLSVFWWISFFLLIGGTFLLALESKEDFLILRKKLLFYSVLSSIFFALSYFFIKAVFLKSSFINGFVWSRVGTLLPSLFFLFFFREKIFRNTQKKTKELTRFLSRKFWLFILSRGSGAFSFLLLNYAIKLGSVTIVNAVGGAKYVFIFFFSLLLSVFYPAFLKEEFSRWVAVQKFAGALLVAGGVALLFLK